MIGLDRAGSPWIDVGMPLSFNNFVVVRYEDVRQVESADVCAGNSEVTHRVHVTRNDTGVRHTGGESLDICKVHDEAVSGSNTGAACVDDNDLGMEGIQNGLYFWTPDGISSDVERFFS